MDKATAQADMDRCALNAFIAADAELNKDFQQLVLRLGDDAGKKKLLVTSQRAWLAFRDDECAFTSSGVLGGSAYPTIYDICRDQITRKRVEDFKSYLACKEGDLRCPTSGAQ